MSTQYFDARVRANEGMMAANMKAYQTTMASVNSHANFLKTLISAARSFHFHERKHRFAHFTCALAGEEFDSAHDAFFRGLVIRVATKVEEAGEGDCYAEMLAELSEWRLFDIKSPLPIHVVG